MKNGIKMCKPMNRELHLRLDQLPSLNLIFTRFTIPASIKNSDSASKLWTLPSPIKKAKSFENKIIEKKFFYSQKFRPGRKLGNHGKHGNHGKSS